MSTITVPDLPLIIHAESTAPSNSEYEYTPLPAQGWTRVSMLHPALAVGDVSCELEARSIEDAAASGFEALSYVWASGDDVEVIEIGRDGHIIRITDSLACGSAASPLR